MAYHYESAHGGRINRLLIKDAGCIFMILDLMVFSPRLVTPISIESTATAALTLGRGIFQIFRYDQLYVSGFSSLETFTLNYLLQVVQGEPPCIVVHKGCLLSRSTLAAFTPPRAFRAFSTASAQPAQAIPVIFSSAFLLSVISHHLQIQLAI